MIKNYNKNAACLLDVYKNDINGSDKEDPIQSIMDFNRALSSITKKTEDRLTPVFNLFYDYLPTALLSAINQAVALEPHRFGIYNERKKKSSFTTLGYHRLTDTPLGIVCRLVKVQPKDILDDVQIIAFSESSFLNHFTNCARTKLINALENLLHVKSATTSKFVADQSKESFKKAMATALASAGCTKILNSQITKVHYKTLGNFYKKEIETRIRRKSNHIEAICQNNDFASYIMFMIAMYSICRRVLENLSPNGYHFEKSHLSTEMSLPLAVGVYNAAAYVHDYFGELDVSGRHLEFPCFDDLYAILDLYLKDLAEATACPRCATPLLDVKLEGGEYMPLPCCPRCSDDYYTAKKKAAASKAATHFARRYSSSNFDEILKK